MFVPELQSKDEQKKKELDGIELPYLGSMNRVVRTSSSLQLCGIHHAAVNARTHLLSIASDVFKLLSCVLIGLEVGINVFCAPPSLVFQHISGFP